MHIFCSTARKSTRNLDKISKVLHCCQCCLYMCSNLLPVCAAEWKNRVNLDLVGRQGGVAGLWLASRRQEKLSSWPK